MTEIQRIKGRLGLKLPIAAEKPTQRREGHQTIRVRSARQLRQTARRDTAERPTDGGRKFYTKKKVGPEIRAKGEAILEKLKTDSPHFFR